MSDSIFGLPEFAEPNPFGVVPNSQPAIDLSRLLPPILANGLSTSERLEQIQQLQTGSLTDPILGSDPQATIPAGRTQNVRRNPALGNGTSTPTGDGGLGGTTPPIDPLTGDPLDDSSTTPDGSTGAIEPTPALTSLSTAPTSPGIQFTSGAFTALSATASVEFQWDGGGYSNTQLGIFSLEGMEQFTGDAFHREAARRATTNSPSGHLLIDDRTEGAKFGGKLNHEDNFNQGPFNGVKTFSITPGAKYGLILIPDGALADIATGAAQVVGSRRPLYSMATANPDQLFQAGQLVEAGSDPTRGNTYIFEDLRLDQGSDRDYNDIVVRLRGFSGSVPSIDQYIDPNKDWRKEEAGKLLLADALPYVTVEPSQPTPSPTPSPATGNNPSGNTTTPPTPAPSPTPPTTESPAPNAPAPSTPVPSTTPVTSPLGTFPWTYPTIEDLAAAAITPTSKFPIIGVIDTGFARSNPDLDYSKIVWGKDYIDNDADPLLNPGEGNEHGTHILGLISALRNNGVGIDGLAPDAPIWAARAVGSGSWAKALVDYVDYIKSKGQTRGLVNLSFDLTQKNADGTISTRYEFTPEERVAIEQARQAGVVLVVAAGNSGTGDMSVLAQAAQEFNNIWSVAAAEQIDRSVAIADGAAKTDYSSSSKKLTISAIGGSIEQGIPSLLAEGLGTMAGTSVATAKVTANAALAWAANPSLNYLQLKDVLTKTATDIEAPGYDELTGYGIVNGAAAVSLAKMTKGETYNPEPWFAPDSWLGEGLVQPWERPVSGGNSIASAPTVTSGFSDTSQVSAAQPNQYYRLVVDRTGFLEWTMTRQGASFPNVSLVNAQGQPAQFQFLTGSANGIGTAGSGVSGALPTERQDGWFVDPGIYFLRVNSTDAMAAQPYALQTEFTADAVPSLSAAPALFRTQPQTINTNSQSSLFAGSQADQLNVNNTLSVQAGTTTQPTAQYGLEVQSPVSVTLNFSGQTTTTLRLEKFIGTQDELSALEINNTPIVIGGDRGRPVTLTLNPGRYRLSVGDSRLNTLVELLQQGIPVSGDQRAFSLSATVTPLATAPQGITVPANAGAFVETVTSSSGVVTHYYRNGYASVQPSGVQSWYSTVPGNLATGLRPLASPIQLQAFNNPGDLNGDRRIDLITQRYSTPSGNTLSNQLDGAVAFSSLDGLNAMNGSSVIGGFGASGAPNLRLPDWRAIATGDFDGDGQSEALWYKWRKNGPADEDAGTLALWFFNKNTSTYTSKVIGKEPLAGNWRPAGTGDFNRDGKTDILWHKFGDGEGAARTANSAGMLSVWLMDRVLPNTPETNILGKVALEPKLTDWRVGGTGDFNRDGVTDIFWQNPSNGRTAIWLMNDINLSTVPQGSVDLGEGRAVPDRRVAAIGNFDSDPNLEVIWRGSTSNSTDLAVWQMEGSSVQSASVMSRSSTATDWLPLGGLDSTVGFGSARPALFWREYGRVNGAADQWVPTSAIRQMNRSGSGQPVLGDNSEIQWFEKPDGSDFAIVLHQNADRAMVLQGSRNGQPSHAAIYEQRRGLGLNNAPLGKLLKDTYRVGQTTFSEFEYGRLASHDDGRVEFLKPDQQPHWLTQLPTQRYSDGTLAVQSLDALKQVAVSPITDAAGNLMQMPGWRLVGQGDFNQDRKPDLLLQKWRKDSPADTTVGTIRAMLMDGGSGVLGVADVGQVNPDSHWRVMTAGDFDGDGISDIVLQKYGDGVGSQYQAGTAGSVGIWLMRDVTDSPKPDGVVTLTPKETLYRVMGAADFDGNGIDDLIWHNPNNGDVGRWSLGNVRDPNNLKPLGTQSMGTALPDWRFAGVGNVNQDGTPDLLWRGSTATNDKLAYWLMGSIGNQQVAPVATGLITNPAGMSVANAPDWLPMGDRDVMVGFGSKAAQKFRNAYAMWNGSTEPFTPVSEVRSMAKLGGDRSEIQRFQRTDGSSFMVISHDDAPNAAWLWGKPADIYERVKGLKFNGQGLGPLLNGLVADGDTTFTEFKNGRIAMHDDGRWEVLNLGEDPSWRRITNISGLASPLLTQQDASYFTSRPQYYISGNIFSRSNYGSSLVGGRGLTEGNCTWYAHGRVKELGGDPAALNSMSGNANQWHNQLSNGSTISSDPKPGDIAQWTRNGQNHVAVVEQVYFKGGVKYVKLSESHYNGDIDGNGVQGTLHRIVDYRADNPDRYIRVPGVKSVGPGIPVGETISTTLTEGDKKVTTATVKFALDDASLWGEASGKGIDFDAQIKLTPELGSSGDKLKLSGLAEAKVYAFASLGTLDLGFSGKFGISLQTDSSAGTSTLSVKTEAVGQPYFSTYLGLGAGLGVKVGMKAGLNLKPLPFEKSIEISNGFELKGEQLLKAIPALKVADFDFGLGLNTNTWGNGESLKSDGATLEADDTAGFKLNLAELLPPVPSVNWQDFVSFGIALGVKQKSEARLEGFRFDPDDVSDNGNEFDVNLGSSVTKPLRLIPQSVRVRPNVTVHTEFFGNLTGSMEVDAVGFIKKELELEESLSQEILAQVLGGLTKIGQTQEFNIPVYSPGNIKPFDKVGFWQSINVT